MDDRVSTRQLRERLADILHRVAVRREPVIVTHSGRDFVRVVPVDGAPKPELRPAPEPSP